MKRILILAIILVSLVNFTRAGDFKKQIQLIKSKIFPVINESIDPFSLIYTGLTNIIHKKYFTNLFCKELFNSSPPQHPSSYTDFKELIQEGFNLYPLTYIILNCVCAANDAKLEQKLPDLLWDYLNSFNIFKYNLNRTEYSKHIINLVTSLRNEDLFGLFMPIHYLGQVVVSKFIAVYSYLTFKIHDIIPLAHVIYNEGIRDGEVGMNIIASVLFNRYRVNNSTYGGMNYSAICSQFNDKKPKIATEEEFSAYDLAENIAFELTSSNSSFKDVAYGATYFSYNPKAYRVQRANNELVNVRQVGNIYLFKEGTEEEIIYSTDFNPDL